ncbi:hypothetical protein J6590_035517 [Homalodisca vitripennis]|nr:hypothetical protein J6590_035517 [Homalodisca vitripennis]
MRRKKRKSRGFAWKGEGGRISRYENFCGYNVTFSQRCVPVFFSLCQGDATASQWFSNLIGEVFLPRPSTDAKEVLYPPRRFIRNACLRVYLSCRNMMAARHVATGLTLISGDLSVLPLNPTWRGATLLGLFLSTATAATAAAASASPPPPLTGGNGSPNYSTIFCQEKFHARVLFSNAGGP